MKLARPFPRLFTTFSATSWSEPVSKSWSSNDPIKELHAHFIRSLLHTDPSWMSDVIRAYAFSPTCLQKAQVAFDQIERPTLLIWNYMIRGLSQSDRPVEAIRMYDQMRTRGLCGNNLTLIFVLKACARASDLVCGQKVHVHAFKLGFESYLYVCNALIHMYSSCGDLGFARKMFDEMSDRDLVSWNSLICAYSQSNRFRDVLGLFDAMRAANVKADAVTMVKVILACSHLGDREISDSMVKYIEDNCIEIDVYLGNTLIDMYGRHGRVELAREVFDGMVERNQVSWNAMLMGHAKVGDLVAARKLFDDMPTRDVISWTSMITGYSQAMNFSDAMALFREMMIAKVQPDEITVASVLSACAHLGTLDLGTAVHEYIRKYDIKADVYVGNSLIDMYCKCDTESVS